MKITKKIEKIELNAEEERAFDIVCTVLDIVRSESENDHLAETADCARELVLEAMEYFE